MTPPAADPAALSQPTPQTLALSGAWTALGLGAMEQRLQALRWPAGGGVVVDGSGLKALDTAGAWLLQGLRLRLAREQQVTLTWQDLPPAFAKLLGVVEQQRQRADAAPDRPAATAPTRRFPAALDQLGQASVAALRQTGALLSFVGESAAALAGCVAHPSRLRWRPVLFNIRLAGFDALPIVGLLSFLLGVVVAYQGADQLRRYGANIFVVDLVGVSMLREFAPLITAIIVAGRSGSAYAAQIGTMAVTEEIDALRTMGLAPLEVLVLPKVIALVIALPLLTFFADALGVAGGMVMARSQLGVGFPEFTERFVKAVSATSYFVGLAKAPVFAALIATIGCFQGFQTRGGADSVGRHTTRAVVQAIFAVIVADALFSVAFSALGL
jgi:phospholipid/cholesterol/gamma-HCH transport system permease protein